jgi:hypothetical protein
MGAFAPKGDFNQMGVVLLPTESTFVIAIRSPRYEEVASAQPETPSGASGGSRNLA